MHTKTWPLEMKPAYKLWPLCQTQFVKTLAKETFPRDLIWINMKNRFLSNFHLKTLMLSRYSIIFDERRYIDWPFIECVTLKHTITGFSNVPSWPVLKINTPKRDQNVPLMLVAHYLTSRHSIQISHCYLQR